MRGVLRPERGGVASTQSSPGAPAKSPIKRRTVRETGNVSNHVHARKPPQRTQPKTVTGGTRQGQPQREPREGTTRSKPSAPALPGDSEPGSRAAPTCPAQLPSKSKGASPRGGKRHHGVGKADRSTESDGPGRGAAHHAGPRGTPERHAAGHNQGTRTGTKQQRPPYAAKARKRAQHATTQGTRTGARQHRLQFGWTGAPPVAYPAPTGYETAAVRMHMCAPRSDTPHTQHSTPSAHSGKQEPSGPRIRKHKTQHNTQSEHTGEQEPSGRGHRARNTPCRAYTLVNRTQVAQDTAHTTQHAERTHT